MQLTQIAPGPIRDSEWCALSEQGNHYFAQGAFNQAESRYLKALLRIQDCMGGYWTSQTDYHWPAMLIVSSANYAKVLIRGDNAQEGVRVLSEATGLIERTLLSHVPSVAAKEGCALHAPRMLGQVISLSKDWHDLRRQMSEPLHSLKHSCRWYLEGLQRH